MRWRSPLDTAADVPSRSHSNSRGASVRFLRKLVSSRFVLLLVAVIVLGRLASHWLADRGGLRELVAQWGPWAPLVTLVVQSLTSMTPVGAVVISIANGALFPFWVAVGLNLA